MKNLTERIILNSSKIGVELLKKDDPKFNPVADVQVNLCSGYEVPDEKESVDFSVGFDFDLVCLSVNMDKDGCLSTLYLFLQVFLSKLID